MQSIPQLYRGNPLGIVRLWAHECMRVFDDRLIFQEDKDMFMIFMRNGMKEFPEFKEEVVMESPLIYTSFVSACEGHDKAYFPIKDMGHLKGILENKLAEYNE
jgi:dynein heavy chain